MAFSCSCQIHCLYIIVCGLFLNACMNQWANVAYLDSKILHWPIVWRVLFYFYSATWSYLVFLALSPSKRSTLLDMFALAWFSSSIWFGSKWKKLEIGFLRFSKLHYFSLHFSCLLGKLDFTHSTLFLLRPCCKVSRFYLPCLLSYVCLSLTQIVGIVSFKCW